jgi:hypothetical protein
MSEKDTALTVISEMPLVATPEVVVGALQSAVEMGITPFSLPGRIHVPTGGAQFFSVPTITGEKPMEELVGVVVYVKRGGRAWYRVDFEDSGGGSPPDCSSSDGVTGFGNRSLDGEGAPSEAECATCPYAQFGSKASGAGQACSESWSVYMYSGDGALPYLINVPPTSLKEVQRYAGSLLSAGVNPNAVVTRVTLKKAKSKTGITYSKLNFECIDTVPKEYAEQIAEVRKHVETFATQDAWKKEA